LFSWFFAILAAGFTGGSQWLAGYYLGFIGYGQWGSGVKFLS